MPHIEQPTQEDVDHWHKAHDVDHRLLPLANVDHEATDMYSYTPCAPMIVNV